MYRCLVFLAFFICDQSVFTAIIDQRQNGDLNVQIDFKNLKIVGLMKGKEEYVDYDYAYDYSEMTIKPSSGTTKPPLNVTESPLSDKNNTSVATTVFAELDPTTISIQNTTVSSIGITTHRLTTNEPNTVTTQSSITNDSNPPSLLCKKGFFRNSLGDCELKLQNPSNALLKMIKQKSKLNSSTTIKRT